MSHIQKQQQWGVTAPISVDLPTEHELKLTEDLVKTLHEYGLFENESEAQNRYLQSTRKREWIKDTYTYF